MGSKSKNDKKGIETTASEDLDTVSMCSDGTCTDDECKVESAFKNIIKLLLAKIIYSIMLICCIITVLPAEYFDGTQPILVPSKDQFHSNPIAELSFKVGTRKQPLIIFIELFESIRPKTVKNFISLGQKQYLNSQCDRLIPGFLIQCGNFDMQGGRSIYGKFFDDEGLDLSFSNFRYPVAMTNHGPNTNGSQFFINTGSSSVLEGHHVIFGQVLDVESSFDAVHILDTVGSVAGPPQAVVTLVDFKLKRP